MKFFSRRHPSGVSCFVYSKKKRGWKDEKNKCKKTCGCQRVLCGGCSGEACFPFPVFGSKCAPVQHMVNILCAVLLGPGYGVAAAFASSLIRNLLGLGSLMAFPGSMVGALLCGVVYWKTKNIPATLAGEVFGTAVLGGLCAYPVAISPYGARVLPRWPYYAYIIPLPDFHRSRRHYIRRGNLQPEKSGGSAGHDGKPGGTVCQISLSSGRGLCWKTFIRNRR